jgi:hypothetical protein
LCRQPIGDATYGNRPRKCARHSEHGAATIGMSHAPPFLIPIVIGKLGADFFPSERGVLPKVKDGSRVDEEKNKAWRFNHIQDF